MSVKIQKKIQKKSWKTPKIQKKYQNCQKKSKNLKNHFFQQKKSSFWPELSSPAQSWKPKI